MASDPEQELRDKEKRLREQKGALDALQSEISILEADVKSRTAAVAELKKTGDAYAAQARDVLDRQRVFDENVKAKGDIVNPAVAAKLDEIRKTIQAADQAIAELEKELDEGVADSAAAKLKNAVADYEAAVKKANETAAAYAQLKDAIPSANAKLKDAKAVYDEAVKAIPEGRLAEAWFSLDEARKQSAGIVLKPAAEYTKALTDALDAAEDAKDHMRLKKQDWDAKKAAIDVARKSAEKARADRRKIIAAALHAEYPGN